MEPLGPKHPLVTTVITIAFAFGGSWAGAQMRVDNLEKRVERLENDASKRDAALLALGQQLDRLDRKLSLWICSQDPKRCD